MFQSQTRRLLPRNTDFKKAAGTSQRVSIADATLASPQLSIGGENVQGCPGFNRRRDACFPATCRPQRHLAGHSRFNRRRDACFPATRPGLLSATVIIRFNRRRDACFPATPVDVNITRIDSPCFNRRRDACFPATKREPVFCTLLPCFNRRRDACFPATYAMGRGKRRETRFNRRRDACFPATQIKFFLRRCLQEVSIADATLASPQPWASWSRSTPMVRVSIADATLASPQLHNFRLFLTESRCFNRRRDACFPAT